MFNLIRNCQTLSQHFVVFFIPSSSLLPYPQQYLVWLVVLMIAIIIEVRWNLDYWLMTDTYFHGLIYRPYIFFGKVSVYFFCLFLIVLYRFWIQVLYHIYMICKDFSQPVAFNCVFWRADVFNFGEVEFVLLWAVLWVSYLRKLCLTKGHKYFSLCFSTEIL